MKNIKNFIKNIGRIRILAVFFWIFIITIYFLLKKHYGFTNLFAIKYVLYFLHTQHFARIYFVIIFTLRQFLFVPGTFFVLFTPFLFGYLALPIVLLAGIVSSTISYFIGKFLGKQFIDIEKHKTGKMNDFLCRAENDGFFYVLLSRLLFLHFDVIGYICGILKIKYKDFIFATIIGSIPVEFSIILAGGSIKNFDMVSWRYLHIDFELIFLALLICFVSFFGAKYLQHKRLNKK